MTRLPCMEESRDLEHIEEREREETGVGEIERREIMKRDI